jgi:hypothetical protein
LSEGNIETHVVSGLNPGTRYWFAIKTYDEVLNYGDISNSPSGNTTKTFPSAPQNLQAFVGNSYVNISWTFPPSDGGSVIMGYNIYRNGTVGVYDNVSAAQLWYNDTNIINGVTYTYNVSAINSIGEGNSSEEVSATPITTPLAPQNLQANAGIGYVNLTWEAPSSDGGSPITNYTVYKDIASNGETLFVEIGDVRSYYDTDVIDGVIYYYKVGAKNAIGEGPLSNEVNATPSAPLNQPPTCNISYPNTGATVSGVIEVNGTASDADGTVQRVEIKIDDGNWIWVPGTAYWSYNLDTTPFSNGEHTVYVRSFDGNNYSSETSINVEVDNPKAEEKEDMWLLWILILIIIIVLLIVALLVLKRRRPMEEEKEEEEFEEDVPPPPPKKAKVTELFGEEEEGKDEMDRLPLPEPDEEY